MTKFETALQTKKMKLPQPRAKRVTPNPTTDAEMITDLRLSQWKNSQEKKRVEREKIAGPTDQPGVNNLLTKSWSQQEVDEVKNTDELPHYKFGGANSERTAPFRFTQLRDESYNEAMLRTGRGSLRDYTMMPTNEACSARSYRDHNQDFEMRKMRIERPVEQHSNRTD